MKNIRNTAQDGDKPDYASLAYGEYGGKAGIWRIMDVLNRNGVKGTIDTNGRIAEDFPDALKELHAGGHEIVGHGWVNDTALSSLDADSEKELHPANSRRLAAVTGKRPVGWVSPGHRVNEYTFGNFVDEGIFWTGDLPGPDIPQHRMVNGKPLVIMPRLDYANDLSLSVHAEKSRTGLFRQLQGSLRLSLRRGTSRRAQAHRLSRPRAYRRPAQHHRRV